MNRYLSMFLVILTVLLTGCSADFSALAEKRLAHARKADFENRDIHVVAINDKFKSDYIRGVQLAAEEINKRPEKLLSRNLVVTIEDTGNGFNDSRQLIHKIVSNPAVVAVLGHRSSKVAVPASVIYEKSQVIFMPPFSTAKKLTGHAFKYVFRMLPSNEIMADQLANAASSLGYRNIVILYARDDFNRELAFLFEDAALKNNIKLVKRASFFDKDTNFRPIISQFNSEQFDSVFIAAGGKTSALMVRQMREMGLEQPIIGSDSVNNQDYRNVAGEAANKTVFPITYSNLDSNNERNNHFIKRFKDKYFREPDYNAAQGYDSMMLLSEAIERSNSTLTPTISSTLHFMPAWVGITGLHKFDQSGELLGKTYKFNAWNDDQIKPLPALHNIYLLERFNAAHNKQEETSEEKASEEVNGNRKKDFASIFSTRMHEDDHKLQMLHLAYAALKFKKIGIIYEDNKIGRKNSGFDLLTALKKSKDIEIVGCKVPFSLIKKEQIDKRLIDCYGKLSLTIDAMLVPIVQNASPVLMQKLSAGLAFFKIPAIGFEAKNMDQHTSLAITRRTDVNKNTVSAYSGLLSGLKVHEFSTKIQGLPDIYVNMEDLQRMGRSEQEILLLSPDYLLESNDAEIGL